MTTANDLHESGHAAQVRQRISEHVVAAGGWLGFDEYMRLALYEPGLGYYSAGAAKLGAGGDFTTAPELSPLFGRCLARHCVEVLATTGGSDVLELGAGSGRLAFDVLTAMDAAGRPPGHYRILEVSADLRARQRALLATLPPSLVGRVQWLDGPPEDSWRGALLANEVLDALPFKRIRSEGGYWKELGVALDDAGQFSWQTRAAAPVLRAQIDAALPDLPDGYETELCPMLSPWITEVTASMQQGVALFIDYGLPRAQYYHPDRASGTLRCHYRHRAHDDPFAHPGLEDITAWVDFTAVAEAANIADLWVLGFATQAAALLGLGIEAGITDAPAETTRIRRASEARQLLMPTEMGETFKMMALGRGFDAPLAAFHVQDLRRSL